MESIAPATTQMGGQSRTVTMRSDPRMVAASVAVNPAAAAMQALQGQAGSGEAGGVPGDKNYTGGGVYVPGIPYPVSPSSLTPEMLKKAKAWGGSASSAASLKSAVDGLGVPMLGYLRNTQNYIHLAASGLTLFDVAPTRVEKDLAQWQPICEWLDA